MNASYKIVQWPVFKKAIALLFFIGLFEPSIAQPNMSPTLPSFKLKWTNHFYSWKEFGRNEGSTPLLTDDFIILGTESGKIMALSRKTGKKKWEYEAESALRSQPTYGNNKIFIGDDLGVLHCIHLNTGKPSWNHAFESQIRSAPVFQDGIIYGQSMSEQVFALDAETGKLLWILKPPPQQNLSMQLAHSPVVHKGILYASFSNGSVMAVESLDGKVIWGRHLGNSQKYYLGAITPIVLEEQLFVPIHGQGLFALGLKTGAIRWKMDETEVFGLAKGNFTESEKTPQPLMNPRIFLSTLSGKIYALDSQDGKIIWEKALFEDPKVLATNLKLYSDFLLIGNSKGTVWGIQGENGEKLWEFKRWFKGGPYRFSPPVEYKAFALWNQEGTLFYFEF